MNKYIIFWVIILGLNILLHSVYYNKTKAGKDFMMYGLVLYVVSLLSGMVAYYYVFNPLTFDYIQLTYIIFVTMAFIFQYLYHADIISRWSNRATILRGLVNSTLLTTTLLSVWFWVFIYGDLVA